ncbi:hypothetical protein SK355_01415 [Candidatus Fukatsuia symbiotica]|nr:hypothetical protein [Candidatus Fukatsuia symbiotica]MEA9444012.1 hypothetical protein [Candidatus Fukatsuia symbiotica]
MKKVMIVCGVVTLVGCTGFSLIKNFGSEPLVTEASKVGATKQHVLQVGGQPRQS